MLVNITERHRNPLFPSGLLRRMGYEHAVEGRERQHGSDAYEFGYLEGLKASRRKDDGRLS